jgi:hypothetical protein
MLPTTGGDVSQIIASGVARRCASERTAASRGVSAFQRRPPHGHRFDPTTDVFKATLGTRTLQVDAGEFVGDEQSMSFSSDGPPSESVSLVPDSQSVSWSTGNDTFTETVPGVLSQRVTIGDHGYLLRASTRAARPALGFGSGLRALAGPIAVEDRAGSAKLTCTATRLLLRGGKHAALPDPRGRDRLWIASSRCSAASRGRDGL